VRLAPVKVLLVLTLAATGLVVAPGTSTGETSRVKAAGSPGSFSWKPATKKISKGDKVVWKNPTSADHTVTAYGGGWNKDARFSPGESVRAKFGSKGTYLYRCKLHSTLSNGDCSGMCGKIKVGG
jgi:plastocyanin